MPLQFSDEAAKEVIQLLRSISTRTGEGWLGESWGFWMQTAAFSLSAIAAVAVIYYNGKQSRVRTLIDILMHQKSDKDLIEATRRVNALRVNGEKLSKHVDVDSDVRKDILMVLNNQEFLAVGVRLGYFDENVYKQSQCSNVLRLWGACQGFIYELRQGDKKPTLFQDFEELAKRWESNPLKKISDQTWLDKFKAFF